MCAFILDSYGCDWCVEVCFDLVVKLHKIEKLSQINGLLMIAKA